MAFGGTVNRGPRFDTRRCRRINPQGPNPSEQAKLLGGRNLCEKEYDFAKRDSLVREALLEEERSPDITPVPRFMADRTIRLYLPGRTVIVSEAFGDETLEHYEKFCG